LKKREADLHILKEVLHMSLPLKHEQVLVKRLVEYDLIKTCDSYVFLRSQEKAKFIEIIREALNLLKSKPYDIVNMMDSPLYKVAAKLIELNRDQDFIELFKWYKLDKNKHIVIQNNIAYYKVIPFKNDDPFKFLPIDLYARAKDSYVEDGEYVQTFEIYGESISKVEYVLIRDRNQLDNEIKVPVHIKNNIGEFRVKFSDLNLLDNSLFSIFIRYDGFRLINIKRTLENQVTYNDRDFVFYTTKAGNIGFTIKNKN
jgi:hypothetical protein